MNELDAMSEGRGRGILRRGGSGTGRGGGYGGGGGSDGANPPQLLVRSERVCCVWLAVMLCMRHLCGLLY